jgi:hypothetical protein
LRTLRFIFICGVALAGPALAERHPIHAVPIPTDAGIATEASTIIDAPPDRVAAIAADPAHFVELFPAQEVHVRSAQGDRVLVSVVRKEPWPVGVISWSETVARYQEDQGRTLVVDRQVQPGSSEFFRWMQANLRVRAVPGDPLRSALTYRVAIQISRWAPLWILRRSNAAAMAATLERLRQMAERSLYGQK